MNEGANQLSRGTQTMKDETANMSEDIEAQIDDILSKIQSKIQLFNLLFLTKILMLIRFNLSSKQMKSKSKQ